MTRVGLGNDRELVQPYQMNPDTKKGDIVSDMQQVEKTSSNDQSSLQISRSSSSQDRV